MAEAGVVIVIKLCLTLKVSTSIPCDGQDVFMPSSQPTMPHSLFVGWVYTYRIAIHSFLAYHKTKKLLFFLCALHFACNHVNIWICLQNLSWLLVVLQMQHQVPLVYSLLDYSIAYNYIYCCILDVHVQRDIFPQDTYLVCQLFFLSCMHLKMCLGCLWEIHTVLQTLVLVGIDLAFHHWLS